MQVEQWPIDKVIPYDNNPRVNDDAVDKVTNSIKEFGFKSAILVDKGGVIICGHTRLKAAKKLGLDEVPVSVADDLTPEQVRAYRLADNKTAEFADWDWDKLAGELDDIVDIDMEQFGFELDGVFDDEPESAEDDDYTDEQAEQAPARVKRGDIWQLGEHRLMCGNAEILSDVFALMSGNEVYMVLTDPPYNSETGTATCGIFKDSINKEEKATESLKNFDPAKTIEVLKKILGNKYTCYIFCNAPIMADYLMLSRFLNVPPKVLVWDKKTALPISGSYFPDAEYIVQFNKNATFNSSLDNCCYSRIQRCSRVHKKDEHGNHPTPKPVDLLSNFIKISSSKGDTVLDLFGGSGSTLIAAEQLGRRCYMMELDPHYCDVIIDRWETLTGKTAKRVSV